MKSSLHYLLKSGKNSKFLFYLCSALGDMVPDAFFRMRLSRELDACARLYDGQYVWDRVNYYCKIVEPLATVGDAVPIGSLRRGDTSSAYYYDSHEITRWFDPRRPWNHKFGDIRDVPPVPTIVKSRSITVDNGNAVLLKLNKNRHFVYLNDRIPFGQKKDMAIFRGHVGVCANRMRFLELFDGNPRVDAANTSGSGKGNKGLREGEKATPRLSLYDHLDYRYVMALEGNDVASNLKWVMSSNSLAVMPRPTCETWFMEGRLQGGVHYVEIKPDYSDLMEKMDYYSTHIDESMEMARNANRYVKQFRDRRRERYIGLLVMQKYLDLFPAVY